MDGQPLRPTALRSRSRTLAPSPLSSDLLPVKQLQHQCNLFGILKVALLAILALAILSTQLPTTSVPRRSALARASSPSALRDKARKMPLVHRAILQRLAEMEISSDPDERPYFSPDETLHRMPLVTRIPEGRIKKSPFDCGPLPCRFLLPLRIGEQESNARLHLAQILHLSQELDRTLVLPNVGKSHVGACFKWPFDFYYDLDVDYNKTLPSGRPSIVRMDMFRHWLEAQPAGVPTGRSVVLSFKTDASNSVSAVEGLQIRVGTNPEHDLPTCFAAKFDSINVYDYAPIHLHPTAEHLGPAILEALSSPNLVDEDDEEGDPMVLLLTYDLRHTLFPALPRLRYSRALHALAARLAPSLPYAAIHWRMESIPPNVLPGCAQALVDMLARLHEEHPELRSVWFASDYPYPLDTTRTNLSALHSDAIGIFVRAFGAEGKLVALELETLTEGTLVNANANANAGVGLDVGLLRDTGVRGILDKLVASKATVFVAGGMGCARKSSLTQQIVDARQAWTAEVVEYF
ncbi:hypothetical protein C8F01DRAFT_1018884 [Mycena amicta]|nr:hypothetical protein C8F01DRAFT_1018884 [Mycena amicta]